VPAPAPARLHGSELVLVVEDQPEVSRLARSSLELFGYRVLVAANGAEALALLSRHPEPVQLLLTDVVMPGMNGKALSDHVRQIQPQVRVLFTSGYTDQSIAHYGVLNPGLAYLPKPFSPLDLIASVAACSTPEAHNPCKRPRIFGIVQPVGQFRPSRRFASFRPGCVFPNPG
jgi:CheY-like chemotaxis protein